MASTKRIEQACPTLLPNLPEFSSLRSLWARSISEEETIGEHLTDDQIVALSLNLIVGDRRDFLRRHLKGCADCGDLYERILDECGGDTESPFVDRANSLTDPVFQEEIDRVSSFVAEALAATAREAYMEESSESTVANLDGTNASASSGSRRKASPKRDNAIRQSFARSQMDLDEAAKGAVAKWAMNKFPPAFGSGVVMDAGSACFHVWVAMREGIADGTFDHIKVRTANLGILNDCTKPENTNVLQNTAVDLVGDTFDPKHEAFYATNQELKMFGTFRPSEVYIGVSGVEFAGSGILIGYHGFLEKPHKRLLFACPCRRRIILTTASKIGNAGGSVMDIVGLDSLGDEPPIYKAPIYFVTTVPDPEEHDAERLVEQLRMAQSNLFSKEMETALLRQGLEVHWVTVDMRGKEVEDLVAPMRVGGKSDQQRDTQVRRRPSGTRGLSKRSVKNVGD